jgi:hypothetical protein
MLHFRGTTSSAVGGTSQDRRHMFIQKWHFDEPTIGDFHTKVTLWWTYQRGFSHKCDISMNLPSGIFTQMWHFDEPVIGDFHTKVTFWWTYHRDFYTNVTFWWTYHRRFSHKSYILMNLPSGDFHTKVRFRWTYHRGFSHKSDILMNLPTALFTPYSQFDWPTNSTFHPFSLITTIADVFCRIQTQD